MATNTTLEAGGTNTRGDANAIVDSYKKQTGDKIDDELMKEIAARLIIWLDTGGEGTLTLRVADLEMRLVNETENRKLAVSANEDLINAQTETISDLGDALTTLAQAVEALSTTVNDLSERVTALETP